MSKTLSEWLDYIGQVHPRKIDMTLERVKQVAERLQIFPFTPFCITIAGTNGKGTTAGFLEQALFAANYSVATMASPHLIRFNERLRLNGKEITDSEICRALQKVDEARYAHDHTDAISLSYFEFVTLAGLYLFKEAKVEIAILEVGMGGRLDAVNIIDTDLAIITNIALDHTEYLGPDRESIGREKAGILRPGIPVIYGELDMPNSVREAIQIKHNNLYQFGVDYTASEIPSQIPAENVANAVQTLKIIYDKFPVSEAVIADTIRNFSLAGRWQVINNHIYDVAHNPHGIAELKRFLQTHPCSGKTVAVFSMLNTKDLLQSLAIIQAEIDSWFVAPLQDPLAYSKAELEQALKTAQRSFLSFDTIADAYHAAINSLSSNDRLVVFGSFHTVAEVTTKCITPR